MIQLMLDTELGWHFTERTSMTSMEYFSNIVNVDYFVGRRVEEVKTTKNTKKGSGFVIKFEGGGEVHNFDERTPTPKAIAGAALTRVIFDSTKRVTRLQFGLEEVVLNPLEYAVIDPVYTNGQLVYPQRSEANMEAELPEEPVERIAEGPDEDWDTGVEE